MVLKMELSRPSYWPYNSDRWRRWHHIELLYDCLWMKRAYVIVNGVRPRMCLHHGLRFVDEPLSSVLDPLVSGNLLVSNMFEPVE